MSTLQTDQIIAGLVLIDVTATLGNAWMLRAQLTSLGERLTVIETQHKHNHPSEG